MLSLIDNKNIREKLLLVVEGVLGKDIPICTDLLKSWSDQYIEENFNNCVKAIIDDSKYWELGF